MNLLENTQFSNVPQQSFRQVENNADGNCMYEAVLDAARYWLHPSHDLCRLFPGKMSTSRSKTHARLMRRHLSFYLQLQLEEAEGQMADAIRNKHSQIRVDRRWGSTDELNVICEFYNICVILHSSSVPAASRFGLQTENWSCLTPFVSDIDDCTNYIVIRNVGNLHFVALKKSSQTATYSQKGISKLSNINSIQRKTIKKPTNKKPTTKKPTKTLQEGKRRNGCMLTMQTTMPSSDRITFVSQSIK